MGDDVPLVVWVAGTRGSICPGCMTKLQGEAIHAVQKTFSDVPETGGIVIGVPEDGDLVRVATITEWTTGDRVFGHVPSIRRALAAWRLHRLTQRSGWSAHGQQVPVQAPAARVQIGRAHV